MNTKTANLVNAFSLIMLSLWGYFSSESPSMTALIPTFIGVILLFCTKGIELENKVIAHLAVFLTLLAILGLTMPLKAAIYRNDIMAILRVSLMVLTSVSAMILFIQSFIRNRKEKNM